MTNLPVPVPRTFSVSEVETGGYLNSLRDALSFLLNPPIANLYQNAAQTIATSTLTAISLDSTTTDTYGGHSNSTNNTRYTAQVAGWYWCYGQVAFSPNGTGNRLAGLSKNGSTIGQTFMAVQSATAANAGCAVTGYLLFLNAGDYVELIGYQGSGGNLNTSGANSFLIVDWRHS